MDEWSSAKATSSYSKRDHYEGRSNFIKERPIESKEEYRYQNPRSKRSDKQGQHGEDSIQAKPHFKTYQGSKKFPSNQGNVKVFKEDFNYKKTYYQPKMSSTEEHQHSKGKPAVQFQH